MLLERRLEYEQRQSAREQVLDQIAAAAQLGPAAGPARCARPARRWRRRVMEMREAGMSEEEINARSRVLQQDVLQSTATVAQGALRPAEDRRGREDRRRRRRDRRRDRSAWPTRPTNRRAASGPSSSAKTCSRPWPTEIIERKALDLILDSAEYEDVPLEAGKGVATVEAQAVPGEMQRPDRRSGGRREEGRGKELASGYPRRFVLVHVHAPTVNEMEALATIDTLASRLFLRRPFSQWTVCPVVVQVLI